MHCMQSITITCAAAMGLTSPDASQCPGVDPRLCRYVRERLQVATSPHRYPASNPHSDYGVRGVIGS